MNNLEKAVSLHRKWPSVDAHLDLASEVFYRRKDGMCQVAENVYLENWRKSGFKLIVSSLFADSDYPSTFLRQNSNCLLYTSPSPRDRQKSRMPSSA